MKISRIGIVGSGRIGGTLGVLFAKAGYEVLLSSRHPDALKDLVKKAGPKARAGTITEDDVEACKAEKGKDAPATNGTPGAEQKKAE